MTRIFVVDRAGKQSVLEATDGINLMENLRDNGYADILALCGGVLACATCQIYVAPEWFDRLNDIEEAEHELLDGSGVRTSTSRLSCQIEIRPELDGLTIEIAPPA